MRYKFSMLRYWWWADMFKGCASFWGYGIKNIMRYTIKDTWNDLPRQWWVEEGHWCKTTWKSAIVYGLIKRQGNYRLGRP